MSRIILSNNNNKFQKAFDDIVECGLVKYDSICFDNNYLAAFSKRIHSFGNYYKKSENEFIAVCGTLIYKNSKGVDALQLLLDDFDGNIINIKKKCKGLYLLVINKDDNLYVFNDYYGSYDVNYYCDNGVFFISNSLSDVAGSVENLAVDEFGMLLATFHLGCFNEKTTFDTINKLNGDEYIIINNSDLLIKTIPEIEYKFDIKFISEEDTLIKLKNLLKDNSSIINNCFDNIAMNMTGGLDSRAVLASLVDGGVKPSLLYGIGNSFITPTSTEDKNVVEKIANEKQMPLYFMNWNDHELDFGFSNGYQEETFNKFGFCNLIYAANNNIFSEYSGNIPNYPSFMEFGYFLESLRLREWAVKLSRKFFSLKEFVDDYYIDTNLANLYDDFENFKEYVTDIFSKYLISFDSDIDLDNINIDYFERLRWVTARYSDSRMHLFVNEFTYTFPIFGIPEIHELILDLPASVINDGRFQVKLINDLNPSMLKFPLFSHRRCFKIKKDFSKSKVYNIKTIADDLFSVFKFMEAPLKIIYRKLYYENFTEITNKIFKELRNFKHYPMVMDNYKGPTSSIYKYRQFLIGLNILKNK